jgi:hypothetical protein
VRGHWDDDEDLWYDYEDDFVFPWCKQKMLERSRKIQDDYTKHLWDVAHTPEHIERMKLQRKERLQRVMFQSMKENWDLYSAVQH